MKTFPSRYLLLIGFILPCFAFAQTEERINSTIDSLNQIGNHLFKEKKYDDAITIVKQVIEVQKSFYGNNSAELGITLYNLGYIYRKLGQDDKALPLYIQSLPLLERKNPDNVQSSGITRYYIAEMYANARDFKNAVDWGQKAVTFLKRSVAADDPNLLATVNVVRAWRDSAALERTAKPSTVYKKGANADITPLSSLDLRQGKAIDTLTNAQSGFLKTFTDLYSQFGIDKLNELISNQKQLAMEVAAFLYNKGVQISEVYNYSDGIKLLQGASIIYRQLDTAKYARCLQWLGFDHLNLKMYDLAIQEYKKCLTASTGDEEMQCWIKHDLGAVYMELNETEAASALFKEALLLSRKNKVEKVEASTLRYQGLIAIRKGNNVRALDILGEALQAAEKGGDTLIQIAVLRDYAEIYGQMSEYYKQYSSDTAALHLAQLINDPQNQADISFALGKLYYMTREYDDAMNYFEDAKSFYLEIDDKDGQLKVGASLVELYAQSPHSSQTESMYLKLIALAQQLKNLEAEATLKSNLGSFLTNQGRSGDAYKYLMEAAGIARDLDNDELSFAISFNLGESFYQKKKYNQSLHWLLNAEKYIQNVNRHLVNLGGVDANQLFFARSEVLRTYRILVNIYYLQGAFEKSFYYADKIKAALFLEHQNLASGDGKKEIDPALFNQQDKLTGTLYSINENLKGSNLNRRTVDSLIKEKRRIENAILATNEQFYRADPRLKVLKTDTAISISKIQRLLKGKEALIEYSIGNNDVKAFLVTSNVTREFSIPIEHRALLDSINNLMEPIRKSDINNFDYRISHHLYTLLLKPITTYLQASKIPVSDLIIVGDGALNTLPFELLTTRAKQSSQKPEFLNDRFNIRYNISASLLFEKRKSPEEKKYSKNLIAVVPYTTEQELTDAMSKTDQSGHNYHWSFLKHAAEEAQSIAGHFKDTAIILNDQACRKLFLDNQLDARYIHLASHGYLNSDEAAYSGILLNDGLLKQYELLNSNIHADMVVLSACQSGMGTIIGSEGVMGLPRALLTLHVNAVVASLWPVSDEATKDFMNQFYKYLSSGYSKSIALQKAKIWMRNEAYQTDENNMPISNNHPFFWAPFILIESD